MGQTKTRNNKTKTKNNNTKQKQQVRSVRLARSSVSPPNPTLTIGEMILQWTRKILSLIVPHGALKRKNVEVPQFELSILLSERHFYCQPILGRRHHWQKM